MHPPPTSLKVTILAEKSASISNNSAPFRDASPPTSLNVTNPAEKSLSILVKTRFFFCFFFGDHLILGKKIVWISDFGRKITLNFSEDLFYFLETTWYWAKKRVWISDFGLKITLNFGEDLFFFFWRPPDFGRKKRLNFRFRPKNHSQFWWRYPNFWGFVLKIPPTKIFWIRHSNQYHNETWMVKAFKDLLTK